MWAFTKLGTGVQELGTSWAYDWTPTPEEAFICSGSVPSGIELVPMIQQGRNMAQTLAGIKSEGYKTILGYNEPAGTSLTAAEAADSRGDIVAIGLRVGSPAPANTNLVEGDWFFDFMKAIEAQGSKVDFIALHHYAPEFNSVDTTIANFKAYIQKFHDMYKLPIWVTESAMVDYSIWPSWNTLPAATQLPTVSHCRVPDA